MTDGQVAPIEKYGIEEWVTPEFASAAGDDLETYLRHCFHRRLANWRRVAVDEPRVWRAPLEPWEQRPEGIPENAERYRITAQVVPAGTPLPPRPA